MQNVVLTSPRKNQESDLHLSSFRVLLPADWPNRRFRRPPIAEARNERKLSAAPEAWRCYDFRCQGLGRNALSIFFILAVLLVMFSIGRGGASQARRLSLLLSVDGVPPSVRPSGACLCLGSSVLYKPLNAAEGYTKPGLRLF